MIAGDIFVRDWSKPEAGWGRYQVGVGGTMFGRTSTPRTCWFTALSTAQESPFGQDWFGVDDDRGQATTAALYGLRKGHGAPDWSCPRPKGKTRLLIDLRYHFSR